MNKYPLEVQQAFEEKPIELPAPQDQLLSLATAVGKFVGNGAPIVPKEILAERKSICEQCEHWNSKAFRNTGRCKICGCSTWAKLRMATEKCPLNKWEVYNINEEKPTK
jgi:hypothetical protein